MIIEGRKSSSNITDLRGIPNDIRLNAGWTIKNNLGRTSQTTRYAGTGSGSFGASRISIIPWSMQTEIIAEYVYQHSSELENMRNITRRLPQSELTGL